MKTGGQTTRTVLVSGLFGNSYDRIAPGKMQDFQASPKSDMLPVYKNAADRFWLSSLARMALPM